MKAVCSPNDLVKYKYHTLFPIQISKSQFMAAVIELPQRQNEMKAPASTNETQIDSHQVEMTTILGEMKYVRRSERGR